MAPGPIPMTRVTSAPFQIRPTQTVLARPLPSIPTPHALNMTLNSAGSLANDCRGSSIARVSPPLLPQNNTLFRSCSCPNSDHPGPVNTAGQYRGRGAPELDIFEAEKDKDNTQGQVVSQSAQVAPFTHDYLYLNATSEEHTVYDTARTRINSYHGSAVQQSISSLTRVPSDMFQGSGHNFKVFGFEYWSDPNDPTSGYVEWVVDGSPSHRMGAAAVGPDPENQGGTGIGQRLIPLEPMSIILNLGISRTSSHFLILPSLTSLSPQPIGKRLIRLP